MTRDGHGLSPREFLAALQAEPEYAGQLVACFETGPRPARLVPLDPGLSPAIRAALERQSVGSLYTHQAAALRAARAGEHFTVVTGTASGKTLAFNLPVVERLERDPAARVLYLYPTKALAQDQRSKIEAWDDVVPLRPATYDGDTDRTERRAIRRGSRAVLTNPDMLHVSILPNHSLWAGFLANLAFVVVDEVHTYRGVFGSHVAGVLRRLRRILAHYGSEPQFLCASATVANPAEHVQALTGLETTLIDDDGAPRGERWLGVWNPPLLDERTGERRSSIMEASQLLGRMAEAGLRCIAFARARVVAELVLRYARAALQRRSPELATRLAAYRAGYTAADRRAIEERLFGGELSGVAATSALELGVDVGELNAVLTVGYPGTITSLLQQAGRAGRDGRPALALLVAQDNPLDQFLARQPRFLVERPVERVCIDPDNPYVLLRQAACAAAEKPLAESDRVLFGPVLEEVAAILVEAGQLQQLEGRTYWIGSGYPAADVNIRTTGGPPFDIRQASEEGPLLGTVDDAMAMQVVFPGAIYLHQGDSYRVDSLRVEECCAVVSPIEPDYYTRPRVHSSVSIRETLEQGTAGAAATGFGIVKVRRQTVGFRRHALRTDRLLAREDLELPPREFETEACWLALHPERMAELVQSIPDFAGAVHAAEHSLVLMAPLFVSCEPLDLGGASNLLHPELNTAAIFLYDAYPGGSGFAERCFRGIGELFAAASGAISGCPCETGCPGCLHSPTCGTANEGLNKPGAIELLAALSLPSPPGRRPRKSRLP